MREEYVGGRSIGREEYVGGRSIGEGGVLGSEEYGAGGTCHLLHNGLQGGPLFRLQPTIGLLVCC